MGMKVIIKYIGQLLALYNWRFGIFFYVFVFVLVSGGLYSLMLVLDRAVKMLGLEESRLGRYVLVNKRQKRRHKSDV